MKNCLFCKKVINFGNKKRKYCSDECRYKAKDEKNKTHLIQCKSCQINFYAKNNTAKYCSHICAGKDYKIQYGYDFDEICEFIANEKGQPTMKLVAEHFGMSMNSFHKIMKNIDAELTFKKLVKNIRGQFLIDSTHQYTSKTADKMCDILDEIFQVEGEREKTFDDLINPKTKNKLRLDYFAEELSIAIEYHGKQHYEEVPYFNDSLSYTQYKDKIKEKYCKRNKIPYIVFNYKEPITNIYISEKINKMFNQGNTVIKHTVKGVAHRNA